MSEPIWVPRVAVLAVHGDLVMEHGGSAGLRDSGCLDNALMRPRNKFHYHGADVFDLAAAYVYGLAKGHCFVDGNKRVALAAAIMFLGLNGYELVPDVGDEEAAGAVLAVATATGDEEEADLAAWFRGRTRPA